MRREIPQEAKDKAIAAFKAHRAAGATEWGALAATKKELGFAEQSMLRWLRADGVLPPPVHRENGNGNAHKRAAARVVGPTADEVVEAVFSVAYKARERASRVERECEDRIQEMTARVRTLEDENQALRGKVSDQRGDILNRARQLVIEGQPDK